MGKQAGAEPARPAHGGVPRAPRHSPLSLGPDAFVPRTKPQGSVVLRPASQLRKGQEPGPEAGGRPLHGPWDARGWLHTPEAPTVPGCGAVVGEQIRVQIPHFTHEEIWVSVFTPLSLGFMIREVDGRYDGSNLMGCEDSMRCCIQRLAVSGAPEVPCKR